MVRVLVHTHGGTTRGEQGDGQQAQAGVLPGSSHSGGGQAFTPGPPPRLLPPAPLARAARGRSRPRAGAPQTHRYPRSRCPCCRRRPRCSALASLASLASLARFRRCTHARTKARTHARTHTHTRTHTRREERAGGGARVQARRGRKEQGHAGGDGGTVPRCCWRGGGGAGALCGYYEFRPYFRFRPLCFLGAWGGWGSGGAWGSRGSRGSGGKQGLPLLRQGLPPLAPSLLGRAADGGRRTWQRQAYVAPPAVARPRQ